MNGILTTFRQPVSPYWEHVAGNSENVQPFFKTQKLKRASLNQLICVVLALVDGSSFPDFQSELMDEFIILLTSGIPSYSSAYSTGHRYPQIPKNGPSCFVIVGMTV